MAGVIDADTHVIETERTWEFMDEAESRFKRVLVGSKRGGDLARDFWLMDGRVFPEEVNVIATVDADGGTGTTAGTRDMSDVAARLAHMDELDVDVHVLYPSLFSKPLTQRPEVELALCRSYNRWLAEIWKMGQNRLRWTAALPFMSMDKAQSPT